MELMPGYLVVMDDLQESGVLKESSTFLEMFFVLVFGVI